MKRGGNRAFVSARVPILAVLPLLAALVSALLAGCGEGSLAGTDAGNANKVAGILADSTGRPVAGQSIFLRTADFEAAPDSLNSSASGKEWSDVTQGDGSFAFTLGEADTGAFVVEALVKEVKGARVAFRRESGRGARVDATLRAVGGLAGNVGLPISGFGGTLVTLLGTHQYAYFPGGSGSFSFYTLPPGQYALRVRGLRPARPPTDTVISIESGKNADVSLIAGPPADSAPGELSLRLTFPAPLSGRLLARLQNGVASIAATPVVAADSAGQVLFREVAPGTYTVLAWGEQPLRDTIRVPGIVVNSGEIARPADIVFKIKALIVDGIANHDWQRMTAYNSAILKATGIFDVSVSSLPPDGSTPDKWAAWNPRFSDQDVVILHCNSGHPDNDSANPWPDSMKARLEAFVAAGGGLVNTHATFPGYAGWPAFEDMHGLMWRFYQPNGPSYKLDSSGNLIADPATVDIGSFEADGPPGTATKMGVANPNHPVNAGLPPQWMHAGVRLPFRLKGDPSGITVLAYAVDSATGGREPILWAKPYGKGRVFTDALGHIEPGDDNVSYRCAGYQTTFARGVEWAASGAVTLPLPPDFPGNGSISLRNNLP